jgi:hypothetical protein
MDVIMTRSKIINQAKAWLGKNEKDGSHKEIIDIYNNHKPLARGYKVKYTDSWCATFVSAVAIACGATDIIPLECSCGKMIELAKAMGIWVEDDAHVPTHADIILYDWDDSGNGDATGWADHIGIVESVYNGIISVIEGNNHDAVEYRAIAVNGKTIRCYICPKYESEVNTVERYFKLNEEMNIRKTPNGTKVGVAPQGAIVSGTEFVTHNGIEWLKTSYFGTEGYIAVLPTSKGYAVEIDAPKTENEAERLKNAIKEAIKILSEVI